MLDAVTVYSGIKRLSNLQFPYLPGVSQVFELFWRKNYVRKLACEE